MARNIALRQRNVPAPQDLKIIPANPLTQIIDSINSGISVAFIASKDWQARVGPTEANRVIREKLRPSTTLASLQFTQHEAQIAIHEALCSLCPIYRRPEAKMKRGERVKRANEDPEPRQSTLEIPTFTLEMTVREIATLIRNVIPQD